MLLATIAAAVFVGLAAPEATARSGPRSVAPVAEALLPAVVNISTSQTTKGPQGLPLPDVPKGSPFEELFDEFFNRPGAQAVPRKFSSLGSGFVIDGKEGLVVTNNHVIADADEIVLNFHDGSKLKVDKVLGRDPKSDLALLKVTPKKPLVDVRFGSSEDLRVGDWVMAIGNPFGLGGSLTVGVISAKSRDINTGPYDDYLQTDAAINRGNSGGPLFNMDGEVIGVNTAIISPTGGSIGIGFSIPSDTAVAVIEQLRKYGETRRGWLGVQLQSVGEEIAASLGVPEDRGALVASVTPGSPAEKAGITPGDLIVTFDGKPVKTMRSLPRLVARTDVGKVVTVEVVRRGDEKRLDVEIARLMDEEPADAATPEPEAGPPPPKVVLGLTLAVMSDELRRQYKIGDKVKGVIVTAVEPGSTAERKSIRPGDIIVEVAQDAVATPEDVSRSIDKVTRTGRKAVLLRIENGKGDLRFVAVPFG
ncbi:MAG: Do family serine endopeptidase [Hyphomicrobiaceae bacterium]